MKTVEGYITQIEYQCPNCNCFNTIGYSKNIKCKECNTELRIKLSKDEKFFVKFIE